MGMKALFKKHCPPFILRPLRSWVSRMQSRRFRGRDPQDVFRQIFKDNHWGSGESVSGPGSEVAATRRISQSLPKLLTTYRIRSMLDIPCGDFHWMELVELGDCTYIGADIVPELIAVNSRKYASATRRFETLDATKDALPHCDLVFCRDCFIHLPFELILKAVANFKSSGSVTPLFER